jgi:hypothetical protein
MHLYAEPLGDVFTDINHKIDKFKSLPMLEQTFEEGP